MNDEEGVLIFFAGVAVGCLASYFLPRLLSQEQPQAPRNAPAAVNKETWEWTDWKGRKRSITVHREVRYAG